MVDIILAAGGTGGHLFPAIATMQKLQNRGLTIKLITDGRCLPYLKNDNNIDYQVFALKSLKGGVLYKLKWCLNSLIILFQLIFFYLQLKPRLVVGFGGYTSFLPLLAARILRIKVFIHEQNIFLGRANVFFLPYAKYLATSFQETTNIASKYKAKMVNTGNPVREKFDDIVKSAENFNNIDNFCILVIGGSQGASVFTRIMPKILALVKDLGKIKIIQQARKEDIASLQEQYKKLGIQYDIAEFFEDMVALYTSAHVVIARAGASTIAELVSIRQPNILVPLPSSTANHQRLQAEFMQKTGSSFCALEDLDIAEKISQHIKSMMQDSQILLKQHDNLSKLSQKNAAHSLSELI
ncbi:MAG: undecaprenyldiphospho-muramoylpentapeptide beta-N-acetylglucosaminyltransferase, partial [Rickettsiaceae bacterium]|nr:undecaprenyldiphospho-muramoylpentapeptide beta-N-acetylglucosaminyltransferase [Rickettsiaceae bacterium]